MIIEMSEGDLISNNKIIALFMGWKQQESGYYPVPQHQYDHKGYILDGEKGFYQGDRPIYIYHKSWDWLMPVIDKIESLGFVIRLESVLKYSDRTDRTYCCEFTLIDNNNNNIESNYKPNPIKISHLADIKIDCVYECIIKFIEWYKQNKKLINK